MYDPEMVQPMRDEVTRLGLKELKTPAEVDAAMHKASYGTLPYRPCSAMYRSASSSGR